jgi:hypothetical protein
LIMAQIFNLTLYVGRGFGTFSPQRHFDAGRQGDGWPAYTSRRR